MTFFALDTIKLYIKSVSNSLIKAVVFNSWFIFVPVFQWCCSTPRGSLGVGHHMLFLSSPHLCFIIICIRDSYVFRDDPLMS